MIGGIGTVVGHELVHRKKKSLGFIVSNWLLAITWDPAFGIEHVHGHHKNVATYNDPESARRGEGVYSFIFRSTVGTLKNAWNWESERLAQKGGEHSFIPKSNDPGLYTICNSNRTYFTGWLYKSSRLFWVGGLG